MKDSYTVIYRQDAGWWIGWIKEVPGVNCQERTKEELFETLRITLGEALDMNKREAVDAAVAIIRKIRLPCEAQSIPCTFTG